jgi:alkylhydroperoxidase/carboxymuconolactone decarboxylase family protein YurZ
MATITPEERKAALLAAMSAERGFLPKEWQYVADHDLDFLEAYNNLWRQASNDGKALPIKTRELIFIAILCHRGVDRAVYQHCRRALRNGATMMELLEAVETMLIAGGAPTFATGLNALMKIIEEENEKKQP